MESFFVAKNEEVFDKVMSPDFLMKAAPDYYKDRFETIKEMREADDGTGHKDQEFRRVASFVNVPLFLATRLANPNFLKDKKQFYRFIDKHPEYVSYQRRNNGRGTAKDDLKLPLKALGLDYPGAPDTIEGWDAVEVPLDDTGTSAGPTTEPEVNA
jgi:hypothetical protein